MSRQVGRSTRTLSVSSNTEELDCDKKNKEDGDPNSGVNVIAPELDGKTSSDEFEWEDSKPGDGIIPANSEAPFHD